MIKNKTKLVIQSALLITCLCVVLGLKTEPKNIGFINAVQEFRVGTAAFNHHSQELKKAIVAIDEKDPATLDAAKLALKNDRLSYKKIEFFMNYFFESSSIIYNKPNKVEVEEPYMEYQEPSGFQVMEDLLFDEDPSADRDKLMAQADLLASSAADLNSLLYNFEANDQQLLESVRLELIRVITLNITGYDAPQLKSGIEESFVSVQAIAAVLHPFLINELPASQTLKLTLTKTLAYLKAHPDFDSFNRMEFLTEYALPMQEQLGMVIREAKLDLNDKSALNYKAANIFSSNAIPAVVFTPIKGNQHEMAILGKRLFQETVLSGNLKRSCASCHHPEQYFSDGIKTSFAFDGKSYVKRNAPTLLYAGYQYSQFWDGRAKTLQEQIGQVISNPLEMNGNHQVIIEEIKKMPSYQQAFLKAFPDFSVNPVTMKNLSDALAAYEMSLAPRNSSFDRYVAGDKMAMNESQLKGFNLFMGKAQCGSCHFAPLFNGLIPPFYKRTEYETLGTPANDDFEHLRKDADRGRQDFFSISYYEAAFKTPTVRNVQMTAPYMHNGVFKDLDKVVEFYNQGGGTGLHLDIPKQTLSGKALHLSKDEVQQIVVFMQSLTDKLE